MNYREIAPSQHVAGLIKCFWTLTGSEDSEPYAEPIVPDGCPEIVFNLSDAFRRYSGGKSEVQPKSIVVGQMKSVVKIAPTGKVNLFGVRFWPFGLYPFLKFSAEEMTGRIESLSDVFGKEGIRLAEQINCAAGVVERIRVFEDAFGNDLSRNGPSGREISVALSMIGEDPSGVRITEIAKTTGMSAKQLERRFKQEVGLTPKFLARLLRIQKLLTGFEEKNKPGWADLCYEYGFSDQSHMIREFKAIVGAPPVTFVSQQKLISDLFTG